MNLDPPMLSIVTVNLNNVDGLKKTFNSLFEQTWKNFELIVIDGGSTDGSKELIEGQTSQIKYWVSEEDTGIYNGMNKGLKQCSGKYVVFMNSGDYFLSFDTLKNCFTLIFHHHADVFYGQIKIDHNDKEKIITYPDKLNLSFLRIKVINHQACFFKLETLKALGGYSEKYPLAADYHYYLKAYLNDKKFHPILFPIVKYDVTGVSSAKMDEYRAEMKKVWDETIPPILLYLENNYYKLLSTIKGSLILRLAFKVREYKIKIFHEK